MIENDMVRKVDILEMDPDERVVALGGIIGEAEELRTGASLVVVNLMMIDTI